VPARPEKQVVVSGLGRQVSTAAWHSPARKGHRAC
jgi:hypothetical protein